MHVLLIIILRGMIASRDRDEDSEVMQVEVARRSEVVAEGN